ncbi:MAG: hypothetical protein KDJ47_04965 [Hyphomicrobiaceae bacterium]|nr:hypothetical protein [Hyphomicrobiaceae bacterium]
MRIGFVYDLRDQYRAMGYSDEETAEFDSIETIEAIEAALSRLGHQVVRVGHGRDLARRFNGGERFDLVFSIAEGLKGRSREAQVPALCELFEQPYVFSDPLTMAVTLDKAVAKRIVRDAGVPTAPFLVYERDGQDLSGWTHYPAFVKPLAEGTGKGCEKASMVTTPAQLQDAARSILSRYNQPALIESYLPGREFTVGILGTGEDARVVGVMEIVLLTQAGADAGVYSYLNKEECERLVEYRKANDAEASRAATHALAAHRALGCRDAARHDLRSNTTGEPVFLEVNPIAGLHPSHSDLPILASLHGFAYDDLIEEILRHATARYANAPSAPNKSGSTLKSASR